MSINYNKIKRIVERLEILSKSHGLEVAEIRDFAEMLSNLDKDELHEWIKFINESKLNINEKNQIQQELQSLSTNDYTPSPQKETFSDRSSSSDGTEDDDILDIMRKIQSKYKKRAKEGQSHSIQQSPTEVISSPSEQTFSLHSTLKNVKNAFLTSKKVQRSEEESLFSKYEDVFSGEDLTQKEDLLSSSDSIFDEKEDYFPIETITSDMIQSNLSKLSFRLKLDLGRDILNEDTLFSDKVIGLLGDGSSDKIITEIKEWILDHVYLMIDKKPKAITGDLDAFSEKVFRELLTFEKKAVKYTVDQIKDSQIESAIPELYKKIKGELGDDALVIRNIKSDKGKIIKEWILDNIWILTNKPVAFSDSVYEFINKIILTLISYHEKVVAAFSQETINVDNISLEHIKECVPRMVREICQDLGDDVLDIADSASAKAKIASDWIRDNFHYVLGRKYQKLEGDVSGFVKNILSELVALKDAKGYDSDDKSSFRFSREPEERSIEDIKSLEQDKAIIEIIERQTEYQGLNLTEEQLDQLSHVLLTKAKEELPPDDLLIDDPTSVKAKRLLRWISTKLDQVNISVVEENTKKKISTQLFVRMFDMLTQSDVSHELLQKKKVEDAKDRYAFIYDGILTVVKEIITKKGEKALDIEVATSKEGADLINFIKKSLKLITKEKISKKDQYDFSVYAFNLIHTNKDKYLLELRKEEEKYKIEKETVEKGKTKEPLPKGGIPNVEILRLTSSLINRAKRELGENVLNFTSIRSAEAKKFAMWIHSQLEFVTKEDLDISAKKELASKLFVEICKEVKGKEWVFREMQI